MKNKINVEIMKQTISKLVGEKTGRIEREKQYHNTKQTMREKKLVMEGKINEGFIYQTLSKLVMNTFPYTVLILQWKACIAE